MIGKGFVYGFAAVLLSSAFMPSCSRMRSETADIRIVYSDGRVDSATVLLLPEGDHLGYVLPEEALEAVDSLFITPRFAVARSGEEGFFVNALGYMTKFVEREDDVQVVDGRFPLAMQGTSTPRGTFLAYFPRYRFDMHSITKLSGGVYSNTLCLIAKDLVSYGDFEVEWYPLEGADATYSGMGRKYRKLYVEGNPAIRRLADKVKDRPELKYAVDYPEIRIRQCWKPVPTPTGPDQTRENEPALNVRVTFDRCCDIVDRLRDAGVDRAQLTLVGWNLKGHDGRFPTVFPPEPLLGGEERLRHLIGYAQSNGFQIVPHVCTGDSYKVSEDWDPDDVAKLPDGSLDTRHVYGSGRMYQLCPKVSYEKFVLPINDSLARMGFRGVAYNDVYSIIPPVRCHDPRHPLSTPQAVEYDNLILKDGADRFGGIASEGGYDHVAPVLDFCLYTTMGGDNKVGGNLRDSFVPIWNIVYNGYIYSCPTSRTVNYPVKEADIAMKMQEYGGHPTFYFYSAHRDDARNWMGSRSADLLCGTEEELAAAAAAVRVGYDYLREYGYIQYQTMEDHCSLAPGVFRTLFGDGTVTICNYSDTPFEYEGAVVEPKGWRIFKAS